MDELTIEADATWWSQVKPAFDEVREWLAESDIGSLHIKELVASLRKGHKVHLAVDTLGYLLTLHVTPAGEQDCAQIAQLAHHVQKTTRASVQIVFVDQSYTGE